MTTERIKKADSRFRVNANFPSGKHIIRLPSIGLAAKCQDEGEGILARSEVKPRASERAIGRLRRHKEGVLWGINGIRGPTDRPEAWHAAACCEQEGRTGRVDK